MPLDISQEKTGRTQNITITFWLNYSSSVYSLKIEESQSMNVKS